MLTNIEPRIYIHHKKLLSVNWVLKPLLVGTESGSVLRPHLQIELFPFSVLMLPLRQNSYAPSPWCYLFFTQNEIEHRTEEPVASPQNPSPQRAYNFPAANVHCNPFSFGNIAAALESRADEAGQTRNGGISNALPFLLQQNSHTNHLNQSSGYCPMNSLLPNGNGPRNNHPSQNQDFMH